MTRPTNERAFQYRPSANKLGDAYHRHGPLVGLEQPSRWAFWRNRNG